MAIFHMTAKTISRGSGSAKASSDYINREAKYQKEEEEVLVKSFGNMPEWANSPSDYWKSADLYERENGRLFKKLEFSIPRELEPEQQKELVKDYVEKITSTVDGKLPYSYAIHKGNGENPHCHLMVSERPLDEYARTADTWFKRYNKNTPELGGSKKTTSLKPKEWLEETRERWSLEANKSLERAGHEARIDHRTLEAQGIDREPTQHLVSMLKRNMPVSERTERFSNVEREQKQQELKEAIEFKQNISNGVSDAKQSFLAEKARRQLELERQRAEEQRQKEEQERRQELAKAEEMRKNQQKRAIFNMKEAQRHKDEMLERQQDKQKQKSRGMSR